MTTYDSLNFLNYNNSRTEMDIQIIPEHGDPDPELNPEPAGDTWWLHGSTEPPLGSGNLTGFHNISAIVLPSFNEFSIIKTVVLSSMFVISLVGNTATLIQVYRRRKSTINLLILHLATADLVVTFFCNVTEAIWASTVQWYAGSATCKLLKFLQVFGLYLSTYIIVIISVDRCFAILDPMSRNKAPKRVRTMIAIAWLCSLLFALPQTYVFRVKRGPFEEDFYQCVTYGAYTAKWQEQVYSCLSALLMFILPLLSMVTAYMLIFCTIAKKARDLQKEVESANQEMLSHGPVRGQLFRKAKVKSLRMTALIVVAFIMCWTPYYVLFIIHVFISTPSVNEHYGMWIYFCGMANSMVNPMIYGAFQICKKRRRTIEPPRHRSDSSKLVHYYLSKLRMRGSGYDHPLVDYPLAALVVSTQKSNSH